MTSEETNTTNSAQRTRDEYDIVVVGCGMAGLCAGIAAAEEGKSVAILEKAPRDERGGQTQFTAIVRFPTAEVDMDLNFERPDYTSSDFYNDIMDVTDHRADSDLTRHLVNEAAPTFEWLTERMEPYNFQWTGTRDRNDHFVGYAAPGAWWGGDVNVLVKAAESAGADIIYDAEARELLTEADRREVAGVEAIVDGSRVRFESAAVVIAAGGFESSTDKRTAYIGGEYDDMTVRGVPYNTGEAIDMALDIGAKSDGNWGGAHTSMVDANTPEVGSGVGSFHGYHYGVVLNHDGERFIDEGADFRSKTYAKYGHELMKQPYKEGFVVFDSVTIDYVAETTAEFTNRMEGETIEQLLNRLGLGNIEQAIETIEAFNDACDDETEYDPTELDGKDTTGIRPEKSNWAVPIENPPFYGFPVKPGMTFTFGGLAQTTNAEAVDTSGDPIPGLYVAGNSAGGIFYNNYTGGTGQIKAAVDGKTAGKEAASLVD